MKLLTLQSYTNIQRILSELRYIYIIDHSDYIFNRIGIILYLYL